jgi:hypothetical protein
METIKKDMVKFIKIASTILSPKRNIPTERLNMLKMNLNLILVLKD